MIVAKTRPFLLIDIYEVIAYDLIEVTNVRVI